MNSNVQMTNKAFRACSAAMLLACAFVASNAFADQEIRTETVKFRDVSLSTSAGVAELSTRIHTAAKHVCVFSGDWMAKLNEQRCVRKAEAQAISTLNLPQLTAYYRTKNGTRAEVITASR